MLAQATQAVQDAPSYVSMIHAQFVGIGWAAVYVIAGAILGALLILVCSAFLPRLINKMTPNLDEEKEIARGNQAVAEYFGRIIAAAIVGVSIVVAAAVLGGLIAALHGY